MVIFIKKQVLMCCALLSLLILQSAFARPVSVHINPAEVVKDQIVMLTISLDSDSKDRPDLSVLEADFQILKKTKSTSLHSEKGLTLVRKNWIITLLPLKKGKLTVPSIKIGHERTVPISLLVTDKQPVATIESSSTNKEAFVEVEVDVQEAYVQGQIILTQKIYHSIELDSASLTPPKVKNDAVEMVALQQEEPYFWNVKSKRYHVIERSYALFPKHSGTIQIERAEFAGQVKKSVESNAEVTRVIKATAPMVSLNVKPREASYDGKYWLPAKNVTLYGNWSRSLQNLQVGEPVTLQLGLIADGLMAKQLPDITLEIPQGIKTYIEPVKLHNNNTLLGITGVWSQNITFIPSQSGKISLPEYRLSWWNVATESQDVAVLKKQELWVGVSSKDIRPEVTHKAPQVEKETATTDLVNSPAVKQENNTEIIADTPSGFDKRLLLLPLLMTLLLAAGYRFVKRRRKNDFNKSGEVFVNQSASHQANNKQQLLDSLKFSCIGNNPQKTQQALSRWASSVALINPPTLDNIAQANDGYMSDEVNKLSEALYGKSSQNWEGINLWNVVKKFPYPKEASLQGDGSGLQDMYL